ncbi:MAG: glycosyltransferase [Aurantimonas endophytica]|uniref:Putative glycosyltransferase n=1 Tax=Aurantimonas endophytica TaxID=1522175 RepID=A0A7W6MQ68_9HYPH|nr:glycosyltransferase [Aurantimonas endophytica]MBB4003695.1 putative glycosyltransferase [Aurantimonas endophytica]MCO6404551.1 glycosyl transferase [Aurantimonas endophytica]
MRVLFHVQHLLGVGHLRRAELLVAAMADRGMAVTVALGGMPVAEMPFAGADIAQLPPVRLDGANFKILYDGEDNPVTDAWRDARRDALLAVYERLQPDIVLMEMFPFGRWRFRFELEPLLARAALDRPRVKCVASVRDILVETKHPERAARGAELARDHLDAVLVHSDPALFTFDETYPHAASLADRIHYTGYVTEAGDRRKGVPTGDVIVSAGGGAAAGSLLATAMAARPQTPLADRVWRFFTGPRCPEDVFRDLRSHADERTIVERFDPQFQARLDGCALSISQAGYNTVMNLLRAEVPAVVVPYAEGDETEQEYRARRMEALGLLSVVSETALTPDALTAAIGTALAGSARPRPAMDLEGAAHAARMIEALAQGALAAAPAADARSPEGRKSA